MMKTIVSLGTIREDITLNYDFSKPLYKPEIKIDSGDFSVDGSVHNTCSFLALKNADLNIYMCAPNYSFLIQRLERKTSLDNYKILTIEPSLDRYPFSIIGIKRDGEKQIISYNPVVENAHVSLFYEMSEKADFVYSSFYEVNETNFRRISEIFERCILENVCVMMDLCPLIDTLSEEVVTDILEHTTVISGNSHEYETLYNKINVANTSDILEKYSSIKYAFIKKGFLGAECYTRENNSINRFNDTNNIRYVGGNTTGCGDVFNAMIINGFCTDINVQEMLKNAVVESGKIADGGLPWIIK